MFTQKCSARIENSSRVLKHIETESLNGHFQGLSGDFAQDVNQKKQHEENWFKTYPLVIQRRY